MKQLITSKGYRLIALVFIGGAAFVLLSKHFGPAARQVDNLALARAHAARLEPQLRSDPRFADIRVGAYTGDGGCLWVYGSISSAQQSNDLRLVVEASHLPVPARYDLQLVPPEPGKKN